MDPFEVLGLPKEFALDLAVLEQRQRDLSRVVHPDKFAGGGAGERRRALSRAVDVNAAVRVLRDPIRRAEALLASRGVRVDEAAAPKASPALLMDVMELREELASAKGKRDVDAVRRLATGVRARNDRVLAALASALSGDSPGPADAALALLGELRYLRRFLDEVRVIEEDLEAAS